MLPYRQIKYWISFFSQTGDEILEIYKRTGFRPDLIVTNREKPIHQYPNVKQELFALSLIKTFPLKPSAKDYKALFDQLLSYNLTPTNFLITLHNYDRTLPPSVIKQFPHIFSSHAENQNKCIIYRVTTKDVISEIILVKEIEAPPLSGLEQISNKNKLQETGIELWCDFITHLEDKLSK